VSDVVDRTLEREAVRGDPTAQRRLQHQRCRKGEHCACQFDLSDSYDEKLVVVMGLGPLFDERDDYDTETLSAEVIFRIVAPDRKMLWKRLTRLCGRLGLEAPPPFEVSQRSCGYCCAGPGEPCRTKSGLLAKDWHAARKQPSGVDFVDFFGEASALFPFYGEPL